MEATFSSENSVEFQRTTLRYIPENVTLLNHCREYLKSYEETYVRKKPGGLNDF
jgi:hypothetical protein